MRNKGTVLALVTVLTFLWSGTAALADGWHYARFRCGTNSVFFDSGNELWSDVEVADIVPNTAGAIAGRYQKLTGRQWTVEDAKRKSIEFAILDALGEKGWEVFQVSTVDNERVYYMRCKI